MGLDNSYRRGGLMGSDIAAVTDADPIEGPVITSYDQAGRDGALLRWSLWVAGQRRCYLCGETKPFVDVQIDHVIPKHIEPEEFAQIWIRAAGDLPNLGPHHISNLRACCTDCNSSRLKGAHVLPDSILATHFQKSADLSKQAFAEQKKMRRDRAVGESAVKVTSAETEEDHRLLWDSDLSQALIGTLHYAARVVQPENAQPARFGVGDVSYVVRSSMTPESARMMAAVQLVSGVSTPEIVDAVMPDAIEVLAEAHRAFAESSYPGHLGANSGEADWVNAEFTMSWSDIEIGEETCIVVASVSLDTPISSQIALQSDDGADLIDITGPECSIEGHASFDVQIGVGDCVYSVSLREDDLEVYAATSRPG